MSTITEGYLDAPVFKLVSDVAADLGVRAFVIGGYVRDCFLGRPNISTSWWRGAASPSRKPWRRRSIRT